MIALALAVTVFKPPPTSGPFARDFEAYEAGGTIWARGGDPYSRDVWAFERTIDGVVATRDELLPYVGPAAALPLFAALASLGHGVAVRVWSGVLAAAACGLIAAAWVLARARRDLHTLFAALVFAVASGPMISALALGQDALLSAAAIGGALVALQLRRPLPAALATLLGAIQPNLVIALVARTRDRVALLTFSAAALVFTALTLVCGGGGAGFAPYLRVLAAQADAERYTTIQHTVAAVAYGVGVAPALTGPLSALVFALAAAGVITATVRLRLDPLYGTLLAIAALPLALPFAHEHDLVLALIPLFVLAVRARGTPRTLAGIASAAILVDWLGLAQRPPAFLQIACFSLAGGAAFVALGPRDQVRRSLAAPLAALALCCLAGPLAAAHPAPTWPDGLAADWHAPADTDAQTVWAREQHDAGLDERVPAWAILRAIPLGGCTILGVALALYGRRDRANAGAT